MKVLCEQYEGVGINAMELDTAEKDINSLNYNGERRPITWEQFELRIMNAFSTINKHENRVVYSDMQKLRILNRKINADFLHGTKTVINTELARVPMTMTFAHAMASYRNAVLEKHPVEINQRNHQPHYRRINQTSRGGRGRGGRYQNGNGRGGRGRNGRGGYRNNKRGHPEARWIQGNDGRQIEVHHSYSFRPNIWNNIPREEQRKIQSERDQQSSNKRVIASTVQQIIDAHDGDTQSVISALTNATSNRNISATERNNGNDNDDNNGRTVLGGRTEQRNLRSRNSNIRAVKTTRHVASLVATKSVEPYAGIIARNEMDSNADTCCLGTNFIILEVTNRQADVYPYDKSYAPAKNIPIVTGATAWTDPDSNETFILVFNESLYYGSTLPHSLINPNQLRYSGVTVQDNPWSDIPIHINVLDEVKIKLRTIGTKISFNTRVPTTEELSTCVHVHMTSDEEWNPEGIQMGEVTTSARIQREMDQDETLLHAIDPVLVNLPQRIVAEASCHRGEIPLSDVPVVPTFVSSKRHTSVDLTR